MGYFNTNIALAAYEKIEGMPPSTNVAEIFRVLEPHLNAAYEQGYKDRMAAAREGEKS